MCVSECFRGPHLQLTQLSDKVGILAVSVSCSLVFNIPGDNLFYQRSTEGGGRAMFETKLQGVTGEDIFICSITLLRVEAREIGL